MHSIFRFIILAIVIFAVIGLVLNPLDLVINLLTIAAIGAVIFLLYRLYISRRYGTSFLPNRSGPSRAQIHRAKYTSRHHQKATGMPKRKKPKSQSILSKKRNPHHLKVIEGKKNKKRNRAF